MKSCRLGLVAAIAAALFDAAPAEVCMST